MLIKHFLLIGKHKPTGISTFVKINLLAKKIHRVFFVNIDCNPLQRIREIGGLLFVKPDDQGYSRHNRHPPEHQPADRIQLEYF